MGLGIPDLSSLGVPGLQLPTDEDDATLEAELAALLDDEDVGVGRHAKAKAPPPKQRVPLSQIDKMAADAMKSVDEEDDDEDLDDPDLLAELEELNEGPSPMPSPRPSPKPSPQLPSRQIHKTETTDVHSELKERMENYKQALTNAEAAGETSKVKRYTRGVKTLTDLLKKAQGGRQIDESEIPPPVAVGKPAAAPPANLLTPEFPSSSIVQPTASIESGPVNEPAEVVSVPPVAPRRVPPVAPSREQPTEPLSSAGSSVTDSKLTMLNERKNQFKAAALQAKKAGDINTASEYVKVMKQFDMVIAAVKNNEEVDLSNMPPPPGQGTSASPVKQQRMDTSSNQVDAAPSRQSVQASAGLADQPQAMPGMTQPKTILEALQQREARYKELAARAKAEENTSKARRMTRAHKQYVDAIKKVKSARPVDYSELPSLPDFPPIPLDSHSAPPPPARAAVPQPEPSTIPAQQAPPTLPPKSRAGAQGSAAPAGQAAAPSPKRPSPQQKPGIDPRKQMRQSANQRQLQTLQQKKKKIMAMALKAKKEGDMEEAKRLLKMAKGFDPMIEASQSGLPVNMESIPDVPGEGIEGEGVEVAQECVEELQGDPKEVYSRLKETISKQIKLCATCEKQYAQLGNVATVKRFREMKDSCQQDLDVLLVNQAHGDPVPRFHYEMRTIPSIRVNADLKETEAEIVIIQGMGYKAPSGSNEEDLDTYVKFEFPFPTDDHQNGKGGWGKGTENPTYNSAHKVNITRSRALLSVVKRKAVKFEIYYRKGLLRGDKVFAIANLKLADLENKCEVHDSVQLYEGRKPVAGKLEAKVRIHHPLSGVKEDHTKEKWLVIDAKLPPGAKSKGGSGSQSNAPPLSSIPDSVEVLKWEIDTLKKKISSLQANGKTVPKEITAHQDGMIEKCKKLQLYLREGGKGAKLAHVQRLESAGPLYLAHAKEALQNRHKEKAAMFMNKKKLVEHEIASMKR